MKNKVIVSPKKVQRSREKKRMISTPVPNQLYKDLFENMMHGFTYCKVIFERGKAVDYVYLQVNRTYESFTGLKDLVGKRLTEVIPGLRETDPELFEKFGRVSTTGCPQKFEQFVQQLNKWYLISLYSHKKGYFVGLIDDITELKRREVDLKKALSEISAYKYALDESSIIAITDQKGIILHANENFSKISRYPIEELLGQDHRIINSGYHAKEFIRNLWVTIANGKVWKGELRNKARDGTIYWVDTTIVPFLDKKGKPYQYIAIRADITERKKAEERQALQVSIINSSDDAILSKSLDGTITSWNHGASRLFGYSADEVLGKNVRILIPGDRLSEETEIIEKISLGQFVDHYETLRLKKDGSTVYISLTVSPIRDDQGKIIGASKIARDISERKTYEAKLSASEQRFRALIENSSDAIALNAADSTLLYQSPSVARILGFSGYERNGKPASSFVHPDDLPELHKLYDRLMTSPGQPVPFQYRFRHKNGRYIWLEGIMTNLLEEPAVAAIVSNFRDITERKAAEGLIQRLNSDLEKKVLRRTAQLEAVNKELEAFSYSVSHDLRAPLRIIDGFGQILVEDYQDKLDDKGKRTIDVMMGSARKMGQLIDDLLQFSKLGRSEIKMSDIDMDSLLNETLLDLKAAGLCIPALSLNKLKDGRGDLNLIKQVWLNLLSNAIKYSGKTKDPVIQVGMEKKNEMNVYYVKDNGVGFDMQYADKLFGVFQRLHKEEEFSGTGVGLALVHRIIARHGGAVWAEAKVNEGATFYFSLPEVS